MARCVEVVEFAWGCLAGEGESVYGGERRTGFVSCEEDDARDGAVPDRLVDDYLEVL